MRKFIESLKKLFSMTPEQLAHAETELRFLFNLKTDDSPADPLTTRQQKRRPVGEN